MRRPWFAARLAVPALLLALAACSAPATVPPPGVRLLPAGHVLARRQPGDLRVVSYNIWKNSIFVAGSVHEERFVRVARALDADVWALQEVFAKTEEVEAFFNRILPLPAGRSWHARYASTCMTVSRWPIVQHRFRAEPSQMFLGLSMIDLPDDRFARDLHLVHAGFTCCGDAGNDPKRQAEADQVAAWLREFRKPGHVFGAPVDTPVLVAGDLNIIASREPVRTIVQGDIHDEATFGPDAPPDADGTALTDATPVHNARGEETWTWRWDGTRFAPGRLDYVLYSDAVLEAVHAYVLNTVTLSDDERAAAGLQPLDVVIEPPRDRPGTPRGDGGYAWDHLPVVVDFRPRGPAAVR